MMDQAVMFMYIDRKLSKNVCSTPNPNQGVSCSHCVIDEKDKERFEDLHQSIRACDEVLRSVESNLTSFQNDLGTVSAEIETLQARSTALSIRLENRKVVEKVLGPIVEEISIAPAVIRKISEGTIDEAWVRALNEVEKRSKALDAKSKESRNIKGINDLKPLLEHLVNKVLWSILPKRTYG
jgi:chromosome segregation ATPase